MVNAFDPAISQTDEPANQGVVESMCSPGVKTAECGSLASSMRRAKIGEFCVGSGTIAGYARPLAERTGQFGEWVLVFSLEANESDVILAHCDMPPPSYKRRMSKLFADH